MPQDLAKTEVDAGTLQPDIPPSTHPADPETFIPLDLPDRELRVNRLPATIIGLFQAFLPPWLIAKWAENSDSTATEIYCFLACLIYMGLHVENDLNAYWEQGDFRPKHAIALFMSKNCFCQLYRCFCFWDPDDEVADLLRAFLRVAEVSEVIKNTSKRLLSLPTSVTVDEGMIAFTGRSVVTTLVKGKPDPLGFKIWAIGVRGYIIEWLWHINHEGPVDLPALPARLTKKTPIAIRKLKALNPTQRVVVELLRRLPCQPYHVFCDNLFTSISLLEYLRDHMGCGMTATARDRAGLFKGFVEAKQKDHKEDLLPWNSLQRKATENGKIQQFLYKGNVACLFVSTVFSGNERKVLGLRKRPNTKSGRAYFGDEGAKLVALPAIIYHYNKLKAGIDTANQLRSYNTWTHRIRRGREKCIFLRFILQLVLCNTFLLQKWSKNVAWKPYKKQRLWRQAVVEALFNEYGYKSRAGSRGFSGPNSFKKRPASHELINRGKKRDCKACKGFSINSQKRSILGARDGNIGAGIRKQTRWGCKECDVALCNNQRCSNLWHGEN